MKCSESGCQGEGQKRGLCVPHYSLFYRLGTLEERAKKDGRGHYDREKKCSGVVECGKKHCAQGFCSPCYQYRKKSGALENKPLVNVGNVCSVDGCGKGAVTKGFCHPHYVKFLKYGDPLAYAPRRTGVPCAIEGCKNSAIARGWCRMHYGRWMQTGDPLGTKIKNWKKELIDDNGYVTVYAPDHPNARKTNRLPKHRMVMSEFLGRPLRKNENVHHINGVKTDNRIENLELWVTSQPKGQRPQDLVAHAKKILKAYAGEVDKLKRLQYRK
jgi:hypothetical protein